MKFKVNTKNIKIKAIIALVAGLITFLLSLSGTLNTLDYMLTDAVYQRPQVANNQIKIIAIDEKTLDELGALNTWDRKTYAKLLDFLYSDEEFAPKLVVFDMIFQGETNRQSDEAFADSAKAAGGVVVASNVVFDERIVEDENGKKYLDTFYVENVEEPYDALKTSSYIGYADSIQDARDSKVREIFTNLKYGDEKIESLAMTAAKVLSDRGEYDINIPETDPGQKLILRYTTKPGGYEAISFVDILNGQIPKAALKDSILLVGAYAPGMMDAFNVPSDKSAQMYGVEIHANILQAIFDGKYMTSANRFLYSIIYALIAVVFALLALVLPFAISPIIAIIIIVAEIMCGVRLADSHTFLPLIALPVCLILIVIGALLGRYIASILHRRRVLSAFSKYVAPQVVAEISKKGDFSPEIGGSKRHIAVLFVDIRGFTPLSEALEPEQVVLILNEYLSLTTKAIFDNMGTLDKFVGDATMAVFNSPFDLDDYIYRAVCAARDIVTGSEELRKKAFELTGMEVGFGVGVNCGEAIVGNIGCEFRMDYTAIGDTVNTAARLESNAKAGQVLISPAVYEALGDRIEVEPIGEIKLKGKATPMMVYNLLDITH